VTVTHAWNEQLLDQLEFHWRHQLRRRLDGLTDEELLWEPVDGMWSVRRGDDGWSIDFEVPEPSPPPITTIAWRVNHLLLVFGVRNAAHFGREPVGYDDYPYAGDAATALDRLDEEHDTWVAGVRGLGEDGLFEPCGPAEGPFAASPKAALVLHIHREVIHHGAEIALLRDLYAYHFDRKAI
jgi:hypothetical protein